jgi:hypothetical protein
LSASHSAKQVARLLEVLADVVKPTGAET